MPKKPEVNIVKQEDDSKRRKEITRLLFEGEKRTKDVVEHIEGKYGVDRDTVLDDLGIVREDIRLHLEANMIYVIQEHIDRYEYLYNKFIEMDRTDLQNKALKQKEALLAIKKKMLMPNESPDAEEAELQKLFDWDKLTNAQKNEYRNIVTKVYKSKGEREEFRNKG